MEKTLRARLPMLNARLTMDKTSPELKRGAIISTLALLASNFRGIFTFLVARLLGPPVLGTFSVACASLELVSKIAVFGRYFLTRHWPSRHLSGGEQQRVAIARALAN